MPGGKPHGRSRKTPAAREFEKAVRLNPMDQQAAQDLASVTTRQQNANGNRDSWQPQLGVTRRERQ